MGVKLGEGRDSACSMSQLLDRFVFCSRNSLFLNYYLLETGFGFGTWCQSNSPVVYLGQVLDKY